MGTTAEKLTYLNTTKGKIKDSINLTGAGITNEPFRQYAVKLKDAYVDIINNGTDTLYNNFPKVSGSGTDLSLQNTYEAPMQSTLKGNTSQVQLSGKQLAEMTTYKNDTKYTYTNFAPENIKATLTVNGGQFYSAFNLYISTAGTYKITGKCTTNASTGRQVIYIYTNTLWGNLFTSFYANNGDFEKEVTFTNTGTYKLGLYGDTQNITYQIENLMCSSSGGTYEQYCGGTPSPNPSYPQDIHNVSGNNSIVVEGKNLFNLTNIENNSTERTTYTINNDEITITAISGGTYRFIYKTIPVKIGETYTFKIGAYNDSSTGGLAQWGIVNSQGQYYDYFKELKTTQQLSFTPTEDTITFRCGYLGNACVTNDVLKISQIQLELGSTATTYEAYNGTTYPINLPVENLFDLDNATIKNDYAKDDNGNETTNISGNYTTSYTLVKPNTTYTISCDFTSAVARIYYYNSEKQWISRTDNIVNSSNKYTFTTPNNCYYLQLQNIVNFSQYIQLEEGNKANSYTPYGTTPIELCKIGTYQDYIYKDNDKWYLHKEIGKLVLDGSEDENWVKNGYQDQYYYRTTAFTINKQTSGYSNYYAVIPYSLGILNYNNSIRINDNQIDVVNDKSNTNVDVFKTWLGTHNTIIYYVLANTTYTKITDSTLLSQLEAIYNAKSKNGTTNINQVNNDLPFNLTISALEKE